MKHLFTGLAGFMGILVSHSLFAGNSLTTDLVLYALAVYFFFFVPKFPSSAFLLGLTIGVELLFGLTKFGQGSLLALVTYGLVVLLSQQLRFTSPFPRYIVAVTFTMTCYTLLLVPGHSLKNTFLPVVIALIPAILLSYALSSSSRPSEHEFI